MRLQSLTALRFLAASSVVVYHLFGTFHSTPTTAAVTGPGFIGVSFFFVLSGFVLSWSRQSQERASRFYRNRFARVWPTHALTWVVAIGALGGTGIGNDILALVLVQAFVPHQETYFSANFVSWTLSCEAFFYALFPWIFTRWARLPLKRTLMVTSAAAVFLGVLIFLLTPAGLSYYLLYICPLYRVFEFLIGIRLAVAVRQGLRVRLSYSASAVLILVPVSVVAALRPITVTTYDTHDYWLYDLAALPGIVALILVAATRDVSAASGRLGHPILVRLGEWSFALYMTHQLVIRVLVIDVESKRLGGVLAALLVLPVAGLTHSLWERPVERRLRAPSRAS